MGRRLSVMRGGNIEKFSKLRKVLRTFLISVISVIYWKKTGKGYYVQIKKREKIQGWNCIGQP